MQAHLPEKAKLLSKLHQCGFTVPDFVYVSASDFKHERFEVLKGFLDKHRESFKVIARSAHPMESYYKGGTFDSLETYADLGGIKYARQRMITFAKTVKRLSILRQQIFEGAPEVDPEQMGVIVMPFVNGSSVMAKKLWHQWEFGYCRDRVHKVQSEPYITQTPHDRKLLKISQKIETCLGFPCEIEYIIGADNHIFVVQAKNISQIEILEHEEEKRSIKLDGVRRIRKRRNYRERPLYVIDAQAFYLKLVGLCEDLVLGRADAPANIDSLLEEIKAREKEMEQFALSNRRFAILGLAIQPPEELYQITNHYLDDTPELQQQLSKALYHSHYTVDAFLAESDTLIAKDKFRINLCGHDAYGIDTVRNPIWSVFWSLEHHRQVVRTLRRMGFKTGDAVGIDIGNDRKPTLYRL